MHRSPSLFYILAMNKWNLKLKTQYHVSTQKRKYLGITPTKCVQDLYEERQTGSKVYMRRQKTQHSPHSIKGQEQSCRIVTTQLQGTIKLQQSRWVVLVKEKVNHWNRIASPEIHPHKYNQLTFGRAAKIQKHNGAKIVFSTNGAGTYCPSTCKKNKKNSESRHRIYTLHRN